MVFLERVKNAKKSIKIINPYYTHSLVFEKDLIEAVKRGVKVEFVTSKNRDVPLYKYL